MLKAGLQARFHDFDRTLRAAYIGGVFPSYKNYVEGIWDLKPKEYCMYAEDRMEFEGLVLNLGFRLDGLALRQAITRITSLPSATTLHALTV